MADGAMFGAMGSNFRVLTRKVERGGPATPAAVDRTEQGAAGSVDSGYFFRENGEDLSTESIMAFAFTNANTVANPTETLVREVVCEYAGFNGAGCSGGTYANTPSHFFVSNNGQFKLAEVPEPGSLALFGSAMLGAGVVSRKRAKKVLISPPSVR
jgi:hypothetical protein